MSIRQSSCHIDVRILGHSLAKPQNQPNKALQQRKFFKIYITRFGTALNEEVSHEKKPNLKLKSFGNVN
jgi:hypothetical protein